VPTITAGATTNVGDNVARTRRSQSFTVGGSLQADTVSIHAIRAGSPTDNLVAEIQTDNGSGLPSGTVLATGTLAGTAVQTTLGSVDLVKATTTKMKLDTPVVLQPNTRYHVVVQSQWCDRRGELLLVGALHRNRLPGEAPATFDGTSWVQTGTSHATSDHGLRITWTQPRPPLRVFHVVACHGQAATGTKAGTLVTSALTPTPTSPSFNYGNGGAAAGTYPTGWWWTHQITPNAVLATLGSVSPSVSVTKTSAAGTVDVCYMGIQVEVGDMGGGWARYQKSADSTIWWGKRVFADTLFETADVNTP
jgi:hypothetical protein